MSYNLAYTSQFHGTDGTQWSVEISIWGFIGREREIRLEHDEPLVIDWQETKKTDVVQSSTCTLKVSNETDRQMIELMTNHNAVCSVYRGNALYWTGLLDVMPYEEPYSFSRGYVTELVFSDFGFLNRTDFNMTGKHSLREILDDCLTSAQLGSLQVMQMISLVSPKPLVRITLEMLFVSCDRFIQSDADGPTKREVLEDILRPLGLRIMQKNGKIWIYDIEYLRDETNAVQVVWKGTDAYIRGSETSGIFDIEFDPNQEETIIDGSIDPDKWNYVKSDRFYAIYMDGGNSTFGFEKGFYFEYGGNQGMSSEAHVFRTRSYLSASDEYGYARRAWCYDTVQQYSRHLLETVTPHHFPGYPTGPTISELLTFQSGYIPFTPNRNAFQLRVSLDVLFSPLKNPFENPDGWNELSSSNLSWNTWKKRMVRLYIPVKLELIDENGTVLYHYKNTSAYTGNPLDPEKGSWVSGAAAWQDMWLGYYKEGLEETALDGWVTNMQVINKDREQIPGLYRKREKGEYVPLPPAPGRLVFTVSNGIIAIDPVEQQALLNFQDWILWQLYRNPKVTVVCSDMVNDSISKDNVKEFDAVDFYSSTFKEVGKIGCYREGVAPCALGMLFDTNGLVWSKFIKNQSLMTLEEHRLRSVMDQTLPVQPEIKGTAELNAEFCVHSDASMGGKFLVTALRQDPQSATEQVTMARIAGVGGYIYEYSWSDPICVQEEEHYSYGWDDPVCVKIQQDIPVTPEEPPVQ